MRENWRAYIARLGRVYKVTFDPCHMEGMTDDGRSIVRMMLVRDYDGIPLVYAVSVEDLDEPVHDYQYRAVSEALRIPDEHADGGY